MRNKDSVRERLSLCESWLILKLYNYFSISKFVCLEAYQMKLKLDQATLSRPQHKRFFQPGNTLMNFNVERYLHNL
jgi:hypothetical protein